MAEDMSFQKAVEDVEGNGWTEEDSEVFADLGRVITPRRDEIERVMLDLIPAAPHEAFFTVDIGAGQGWLSEAVLRRFPEARVVALDGSPTMLSRAAGQLAPYGDRVEFRRFRLEDPSWIRELNAPVRAFLSCLVIHHVDGEAKRRLYAQLHARLESGGALLIADVIEPTSEPMRRHVAAAYYEEVRRQSLEFTGDLRAYEFFVENRWNIYEYPDPADIPSPLPDHLAWLSEAGFDPADVYWARAGHAVYGGFKP